MQGGVLLHRERDEVGPIEMVKVVEANRGTRRAHTREHNSNRGMELLDRLVN